MQTIKQYSNNKMNHVKTKQFNQQHKSKRINKLNQKNAKLISNNQIMDKSYQLSDEFLCLNKDLENQVDDVLKTLKKENNQLSSISFSSQTQLEDMSIIELNEYQTNLFQKLEQVQENLTEFIEKQTSFKKFIDMNLKKIKSQMINNDQTNNKRNKKIQQQLQIQLQDTFDDDDLTSDCLAQDYENQKLIKITDLRYQIESYTTDNNLLMKSILGQCLMNNLQLSKSQKYQDRQQLNINKTLIKQDNIQINNMFTQGYQLKQNSEYKSAIMIYDQILQKESNNANVLYEKSDCLEIFLIFTYYKNLKSIKLKQKFNNNFNIQRIIYIVLYSDALIFIEKALQIEPFNVSFLWCKCCCLGLSNQYEKSLLTINKALQLDPSSLQFYWAKGECLRLLGESIQSIELFDYVLSIDPQHLFSLCSKGDCLRNLGNYQESLEILDKAIEINPTYYFSLGCKGLLYQNQFQYDEAILYLQDSVKYNPNELCFIQALDYCKQKISQTQIY